MVKTAREMLEETLAHLREERENIDGHIGDLERHMATFDMRKKVSGKRYSNNNTGPAHAAVRQCWDRVRELRARGVSVRDLKQLKEIEAQRQSEKMITDSLGRRRKAPKWTTAGREAARQRMKDFWAERKKNATKAFDEEPKPTALEKGRAARAAKRGSVATA